MFDWDIDSKPAAFAAAAAWLVTFLGSYWALASAYGLIGFVLGWIPALLLAVVLAVAAAFAWPLIVMGAVFLAAILIKNIS